LKVIGTELGPVFAGGVGGAGGDLVRAVGEGGSGEAPAAGGAGGHGAGEHAVDEHVTVALGSVAPLISGVVPVRLPAAGEAMVGAAGGVASTVKVFNAERGELLAGDGHRAGGVAAVVELLRGAQGVAPPALRVGVHRAHLGVSIVTSTESRGWAVPVMVGVLSLVRPPLAGLVHTGAGGGRASVTTPLAISAPHAASSSR